MEVAAWGPAAEVMAAASRAAVQTEAEEWRGGSVDVGLVVVAAGMGWEVAHKMLARLPQHQDQHAHATIVVQPPVQGPCDLALVAAARLHRWIGLREQGYEAASRWQTQARRG